jgi:hypothetical protein
MTARRIEGEEHERVMEDWHKLVPRYVPPAPEELQREAEEWDRRKRAEEGTPDDGHDD